MGKNKLIITIGKHSGFCFGVKRAYDLACVNSKDCDNIFVLGKLVHNDNVCLDLEKRGIKELDGIENISDATVILTAHGSGPALYRKALEKGIKIIDTTCPKVMKTQRLAKNYSEKGCEVIIFGDKHHKEVKSIREWANGKAKIIASLGAVKKIKLSKNKKYCLISQTTQNSEEFKRIRSYLSSRLANFMCFFTICDSTDSRQKEVQQQAKTHDAVIVIGGRDSANSKRLFEIAREINPRTYFIENAAQLKKRWFSDIKKVAVSAGASTPEWMISDVIKGIRKVTLSR